MDEFCETLVDGLDATIEDMFYDEEVTITAEAQFPGGEVVKASTTAVFSQGVTMSLSDLKLESPREGYKCCESVDGDGWVIKPLYYCCKHGDPCGDGEKCCLNNRAPFDTPVLTFVLQIGTDVLHEAATESSEDLARAWLLVAINDLWL